MQQQPLQTHKQLEDVLASKMGSHYKVKDSPDTKATDVDLTKRIVKGVSNTMYWFDSDQDVLVSGSTTRTIKNNGPASNASAKIKNVKDHNISRRVGVPQVLEERKEDGMLVQYFETKMMTNTDGNDTLIEYQEGGIDQHSIGFQYVDLELVTADDESWSKWIAQLINPKDAEAFGYMFLVKDIRQFEFSPVSFGANSLTPYLGVKSGNKDAMAIKVLEKLDWLERQLKNGNQSDEAMQNYSLETLQLKQIISELFIQPLSLKDTLLAEARTKKEAAEKTRQPEPAFDLMAAIQQTTFITS